MRKQTIKSADTHYRAFGEAKNSHHANTEGGLRGDSTIQRIPLRSIRNPILVPPIRRSDRSLRPRIRGRSQKPRTSIGTTDRNGESNPIQMLFRFSVRRRFHRRDVRPCCPIRAHALQTESRTAHQSINASQKGTSPMNLILIKTGANMFAVLADGHTVGTLRRSYRRHSPTGNYQPETHVACDRHQRKPRHLPIETHRRRMAR